jgi:hypothetical protein
MRAAVVSVLVLAGCESKKKATPAPAPTEAGSGSATEPTAPLRQKTRPDGIDVPHPAPTGSADGSAAPAPETTKEFREKFKAPRPTQKDGSANEPTKP